MPYAAALALTLAVELPVLLVVLRGDARVPRLLAAGLAASLLTHPLLWFAWPRVVPLERPVLFLATGEGLVVLAEALVLWLAVFGAARGRLGRAALASFTCNAASLAAGLVAQALG